LGPGFQAFSAVGIGGHARRSGALSPPELSGDASLTKSPKQSRIQELSDGAKEQSRTGCHGRNAAAQRKKKVLGIDIGCRWL